MRRIHFGASDLARTRLRPAPGRLTETILALGVLKAPACAAFATWRADANRKLRAHAATNTALRRWDELLSLVDGPVDPAVAGVVLELWRVLLAEYWDRIVDQLAAECTVRSRIMMVGGVEQLLATLGPKTRWRSPVLEIDGGPDQDVVLGGRGLLLCPSVFACDRRPPLIELGGDVPTVVFAAPCDETLWRGTNANALGALVGRTRAEALRVLTASCTTTELAERLGISSAGASQHATVLRRSGLITTSRIRNTVLHTVTPLGRALLGGRIDDRS